MKYKPELESLESRVVPSAYPPSWPNYNFNTVAAPYALGVDNLISYLQSESLRMLYRPLSDAEHERIAEAFNTTPQAQVPLLAQNFVIGMATGAEFIGGRTTRQWIERLFVGVLHRHGSAAEVDAWTRRAGVIGLGCAAEFEYSAEKMNQHTLAASLKILDRLPGASEYANWQHTLPLAVDLYMAGSAEAYRYNPSTITNGVSDHNYEEWLEYKFGDIGGFYRPY